MISPAPAVSDGVEKFVKTSREDRLAMLRLLIEGLPDELAQRVEIRTDEFHLPEPNYSINTVRHLRELYPNRKLALLIGRDQWVNFASWREAANIVRLVSLLVCERPNSNDAVDFEVKAGQLSAALDVSVVKENENRWSLSEVPAFWQLLANRTLEVSSSEIRDKIARIESIDRLTLGGISDYIAEHKLYQES